MDLKTAVINDIIAREGDYSNDANDAGGETRYGITAAEARAAGYTGPMASMPRAIAESIFALRYWDALHLDEVAALSGPVAAELADTGVNMGIGHAARMLQTALSVFSKRGALYADVTIDGAIGAKTLAALKAYLDRRHADNGETVLLRALNALQGARYIALAQANPASQDFVFGWMSNRVKI